jgi:hypothetical protein
MWTEFNWLIIGIGGGGGCCEHETKVWVPWEARNILTSWDTTSLSRLWFSSACYCGVGIHDQDKGLEIWFQ